MRAFLGALTAWALSATLASAQMMGVLGGPLSAGAAYVGPIDAVSASAAVAYSCSRAPRVAVVSTNACILRRQSDQATQTINYLSNGNFDSASANSFAGTDATCQGSTTGLSTTIAFTSCSSTPNAADTVTGTGVTQPAYLVSCGTFVAGAGSCTLNAAQNIAVAETVTMQVALFVSQAFDGSGSANNATNATTTKQPQWLPSCANGKPGMMFNTTTVNPVLTSASNPSGNNPWTFAAVAERNGNFTTLGGILGQSAVGASAYRMETPAVINTWQANGNNTAVLVTVSDSALHAASGVFNGASPNSNLTIDGTTTTGATAGTAIAAATWQIGKSTTGTSGFTGCIMETIAWNIGFNSTQAGAYHTNASSFYGTP